MATNTRLNVALLISSLVGVSLSYYAYIVETRKEVDESYEAMCDISEQISCSKAFMSEYGRGFGIVHRFLGKDSIFNVSNGLSGMLFYSVFAALCFSSSNTATRIQAFMAVLSSIASAYLAYVLLYILYDFCVVCVTTYLVNLVNLALVALKLRNTPISQKKSASSTKKPAVNNKKKKH